MQDEMLVFRFGKGLINLNTNSELAFAEKIYRCRPNVAFDFPGVCKEAGNDLRVISCPVYFAENNIIISCIQNYILESTEKKSKTI